MTKRSCCFDLASRLLPPPTPSKDAAVRSDVVALVMIDRKIPLPKLRARCSFSLVPLLASSAALRIHGGAGGWVFLLGYWDGRPFFPTMAFFLFFFCFLVRFFWVNICPRCFLFLLHILLLLLLDASCCPKKSLLFFLLHFEFVVVGGSGVWMGGTGEVRGMRRRRA